MQKFTDPYIAPLPAEMSDYPRGGYNDYPAFEPRGITISAGYDRLTQKIKKDVADGLRVLIIDGYHGVDWIKLQSELSQRLANEGVKNRWFDFAQCLKNAEDIESAIEPFLGGEDPVFGTHFPLGMEVFFNAKKVADYRITAAKARGKAPGIVSIFYGCGSAMIELHDQLWYVDLPKDIVQYRAKEKNISNLGASATQSFEYFYKRSYFVEWPALNRLKRMLLPEIDLFMDLKNAANPSFISGKEFRSALHQISEAPFRVRPWFLPGPWGGKYTQGHMGQDPDQPNMAWSYELIVPENGLVFTKNDVYLECSFDCLMFQENERILGKEAAKQFIYEWPIRLDYLDTIDGGNLSVQCHPRPDYIRQHFGETFTQDETYYIANAKPDARVYLGLTEDCNPADFRNALEESQKNGTEINVDKFVNSEPAKPHDLFFIPNGTVHCSGKGNLVLEISATPYIFTFKLYDYLRKDLNGKLRPINIEHGFNSIDFTRRKKWVQQNLIARPLLINKGAGWEKYLLYDSPFTFYRIYRLHFHDMLEFDTEDRGLAVNLVTGKQINVTGASGFSSPLSYLESMIIPAATGNVIFKNNSETDCKVVLVQVRPGTGKTLPLNDPD